MKKALFIVQEQRNLEKLQDLLLKMNYTVTTFNAIPASIADLLNNELISLIIIDYCFVNDVLRIQYLSIPLVFLVDKVTLEDQEIMNQISSFGYIKISDSPIEWCNHLKLVLDLQESVMEVFRKEVKILKSESRYKDQFMHLPIPTFIWKKIPNEDDFNLIDYNTEGIKLTNGAISKIKNIKASTLFKPYPDVLKDMLICFQTHDTSQREVFYSYQFTEGTQYLRFLMAYLAPDEIIIHTEDITKSKKMELALLERETIFKEIGEQINGVIYIIDLKGIITYMSASTKKLFGWEIGDMLNKHFVSFLHPSERETAILTFQECIRTQKSIYDYVMKMKKCDGSFFYGSLQANIYKHDNEPVGAIGLILDISDRIRNEELNKEQQNKYKFIFESMNHGVVYFDKNCSIIEANPSALKLLGITKEQILGTDALNPRWRSIHEDGSPFPGDLHPSMVCLRTGQPVKNVVMGVFNPQIEGFVWLNVSAIPQFEEDNQAPVKVYAIFEDITNKKLAEDLLRVSESSYRNLFNSVNYAIYIQDLNGIFIDVNLSAIKMYGYPRDYFIGNDPAFLSAPDKNNLDLQKDYYQKVLNGDTQIFEFWGKRSNGEVFPKEVRLSKGNYFGKDVIIAFGRDITKEKKDKEELLNFLEINQSLLKELKHRVKNSLMLISSLISLELMSSNKINPFDVLYEIRDRVNSVSNLYNLLNDSNNCEIINIQDYITRIINSLKSSYYNYAQKINVFIDVDCIDVSVSIATPLGLIINELFTNSLKYAYPKAESGEIRISLIGKIDTLELVYADNGKGLPESFNIEKTDQLGLKLVSMLTDQLQGKLTIHKKKPTSFSFYIPLDV